MSSLRFIAEGRVKDGCHERATDVVARAKVQIDAYLSEVEAWPRWREPA